MANNSLTDIVNNFADGKGFWATHLGSNNSTFTAPTITSGSFSPSFSFNNLGTTIPGTLVNLPTPNVASLTTFTEMQMSAVESFFPCYLYQFGTIALGTTTLTHTASVTRMRRTVYGTANTPIPMLPMLYCTTAVAGGSTITITMDYVNQDGVSKTGNYTWSFTGATIATTTAMHLVPNTGDETTPGDTAVLDITAMTINWGTASAGAFTVYLMELLDGIGNYGVNLPTVRDNLYGGLNVTETAPASPDAGTPTSLNAIYCNSSIGSGFPLLIRAGVTA